MYFFIFFVIHVHSLFMNTNLLFNIYYYLVNVIRVLFLDSVRFFHLLKKGEIVELHSMLLTISPFMFWDDPKTFSESILSLLDFG